MPSRPLASAPLVALSVALLLALPAACRQASGEGEEGTQAATQAQTSQEGDFLYQVTMIRAAPGRLSELVELLKEERDLFADVNEPLPFWMRHSQGAQWDLFILYPMGSFSEYYEPVRAERRLSSGEWKGLSERQLRREADLLTSWRDELFVRGPGPAVLEAAFRENDFYHVEMFVALPGRRRELVEERRMENRYRQELGLPENFIFTREAGGPQDSFTIGLYRNLEHFAEGARISEAVRDRAAVAAGFESAAAIGVYIRRLILYHEDTLCTAVK